MTWVILILAKVNSSRSFTIGKVVPNFFATTSLIWCTSNVLLSSTNKSSIHFIPLYRTLVCTCSSSLRMDRDLPRLPRPGLKYVPYFCNTNRFHKGIHKIGHNQCKATKFQPLAVGESLNSISNKLSWIIMVRSRTLDCMPWKTLQKGGRSIYCLAIFLFKSRKR